MKQLSPLYIIDLIFDCLDFDSIYFSLLLLFKVPT